MIDIREVPFRRAVALALPVLLGVGACADSGRAPAPGVEAEAAGTGNSGEAERTPRDSAAVPSVASALPSRGPRSSEPRPEFADPVTIPEGTTILSRLEYGISSRSHPQGDRVFLTVLDEVLAPDGMVLVPEGARLLGTVHWSTPGDASSDPSASRPGPAGLEESAIAVQVDTASGPVFRVERLLVDGEHVALEGVGHVADGGYAPSGSLGVPRTPSTDGEPETLPGGGADGGTEALPDDGVPGGPDAVPVELGSRAVPAGSTVIVEVRAPVPLSPH